MLLLLSWLSSWSKSTGKLAAHCSFKCRLHRLGACSAYTLVANTNAQNRICPSRIPWWKRRLVQRRPKSQWDVRWLADLNYPDQWCPVWLFFFHCQYLSILWPGWNMWQLIWLKTVTLSLAFRVCYLRLFPFLIGSVFIISVGLGVKEGVNKTLDGKKAISRLLTN